MDITKPLTHYTITSDQADDLFYIDRIMGDIYSAQFKQLKAKYPNATDNQIHNALNNMPFGEARNCLPPILASFYKQDAIHSKNGYGDYLKKQVMNLKQSKSNQFVKNDNSYNSKHDYSVQDKIKYFSSRVDDPKLTDGQRNYARMKLNVLK